MEKKKPGIPTTYVNSVVPFCFCNLKRCFEDLLSQFYSCCRMCEHFLTALSVSLFSLLLFYYFFSCQCRCGWWWCCSTVAGLRYCGRRREMHWNSPLWIALLGEKANHFEMNRKQEIKADVGSLYSRLVSPKGTKVILSVKIVLVFLYFALD